MDLDNNSPFRSIATFQLWVKRNIESLFCKETWITFGEYIGLGRPVSNRPIRTEQELNAFISSRSSHVAQSTLFGYLKTRAGTSFPSLFENPDMLASINLAKWHTYVACISDLAAYMGVLLYLRSGQENLEVVEVMNRVVDNIIRDIGMPSEAGEGFGEIVNEMRIRIYNMDYTIHEDDESVFSVSPKALYKWAPIADNLKRYDRIPVENSVRFHWKEVRDKARNLLDAQMILESGDKPNQSKSSGL